VFSRFDKDHNGVIDVHELPAVLTYYDDVAGADLLKRLFQVTVAKKATDAALDERSQSISKIETAQWLQRMDVNGSGTITPEEFDYLARLKFLTATARLQTVDNIINFAQVGIAAVAILAVVAVLLRRNYHHPSRRAPVSQARQVTSHSESTNPRQHSSALLVPLLASSLTYHLGNTEEGLIHEAVEGLLPVERR
jgi:hypothetical protein